MKKSASAPAAMARTERIGIANLRQRGTRRIPPF